jgi:outer membrane protein
VEQTLSRNPSLEKTWLMVEKTWLAYEKVGFQTRQLIDSGLPVPYELLTASYEVDKALVLASKMSEFNREKLALEAQQNYLNLLKALDGLDLARLGLERSLEQKRLAEVAYSAGIVARSDVLGAEAQVSGAEAQLFAAESAVKMAEMSLNKTLGVEMDRPLSVNKDVSLPVIGEIDLKAGLQSALENSMQIIEAREDMHAKERVYVLARGSFAYNDFPYREAKLNLDEARINLTIAENNVRLQVHQLYEALGGMEKQQAALEKSVAYAAESYRLAQLRYEAGIAIQMDVLGAQVTLSELENRLLQARYDRYLTYLQWLFAIGRPVQW